MVVSGGGPMRLEGPISLCARAAIDPTRHFDGQLAQLSIWNKGLSMSQIARLYTLVSMRSSGVAAVMRHHGTAGGSVLCIAAGISVQ